MLSLGGMFGLGAMSFNANSPPMPGSAPVYVPELKRNVWQRPPGSQQPGESLPPPDIDSEEFNLLMSQGPRVSPIGAALTAYYRFYQASGGVKQSEKSSGGILGKLKSALNPGGGEDVGGSVMPMPTEQPSGGIMGYAVPVVGVLALGFAGWFVYKQWWR